MICGDRVRLMADLSLSEDGTVVRNGATGMVVGGQGIEGVVVSWDGLQGVTSLVLEPGLMNINRAKASRMDTSVPSTSRGQSTATAAGRYGRR